MGLRRWRFAVLAVVVSVSVHLAVRRGFVVHAPSTSCVVVTGASSGIGRDAALGLAELGHTVFAGVRKEADGDSVVAEARERGVADGLLVPLKVDVTKPDQIKAAVETVTAWLAAPAADGATRSLAALVNNAGVSQGVPMETSTMDMARWLFEVNVFGLLETTLEFMPLLRASQGRVVQVSSVAGFLSVPFMGIYSASKQAVEGMSDSLRMEMQDAGVSVSIVEPGAIETPLGAKMLSHVDAALATDEESESGDGGSGEATSGEASFEMTHYGELMTNFRITTHTTLYAPVSWTTSAIVDAVTSPYPSARYLVGVDAYAMSLMCWLLPARVIDAIALGVLRMAAYLA